MVKVVARDLDEADQALLAYLSDDSDVDEDESSIAEKYARIEAPPSLDETFPNVVFVTGTPQVTAEKFDKLQIALGKKIVSGLREKGVELSPDSPKIELVFQDFDEDDPETGETKTIKKTSGCCFLIFGDPYEAQGAQKHLSSFQFDKKHMLNACLLQDFQNVVNLTDTFTKPKAPDFYTRENFRWWLKDSMGREQFALRYGPNIEIYWHDAISDPDLVWGKEADGGAEGVVKKKVVYTSFCWSPRGSYAALFHKRGLRLVAGEDFGKKTRFEHPNLRHVLFSPDEEYLVTWCGSPAEARNDKALCVWHVLSGELIRSFRTPEFSPTGEPVDSITWPLILWSHDSKYLAMRKGAEGLAIYQTPTMGLLEDPTKGKSGLLNKELSAFQWSPGANLLSIWVPSPEKDVVNPSRLAVIEIPSCQEVASRIVYSAPRAKMHWQHKGDFLALETVLLRKKGKKTKKESTQIEIFRLREKSVPVESVEIEGHRVCAFDWEKGAVAHRFAVLVQEENSSSKRVWFFQVCKKDTEKVAVLDVSSSMVSFRWSPTGTNFIMGAEGGDDLLVFGALTDQNKVDIMQKEEHMSVNSIHWDPSGRSVCTAVGVPSAGPPNQAWKYSNDAGYRIWSFQGKLQQRFENATFYQFAWRPHPPSLLPRNKIEEVYKSLKEYSKRYDAEDEKRRTQRRKDLQDERNKKFFGFDERLEALEKWKMAHPLYQEWNAAWQEFEESQEYEVNEIESEEELEVKEEPIYS